MRLLSRVSLRRTIIGGAAIFALLAVGGALGEFYLALNMRRELEEDTRAVLEEQQIADRLVIDVHRQILDATRYLQQPRDTDGLESFRARGEQIYGGIRKYLFRDLSIEERLQVERIKEVHQELEVAAQYSFNLALQGRQAEALDQREELFAQVPRLEQAVDDLIAMRLAGRAAMMERQAATMNQLFVATCVLALSLLVGILMLTRLLQNRLLRPLNTLESVARRLGAGDLGARVPVESEDELATVGRSFNQMAASLEAARVELEVRHEELARTVDRLEEANAEIRQGQQQLLVSEKMAALGRLTAGIAHEINSPLGGILNSLQLARAYVDEYESSASDPDVVPEDHLSIARDLRSTLELAESATSKVAQFVRSIKGQTRSEGSADERRFRPAEELRQGLVLLGHELRDRKIRVHAEIEGAERVELVGDPGKFVLVLQNLLSNAMDAYEGEGGSVWIRLRLRDSSVIVEVEDRGSGIPEEIRPRIFDYLFTTKDVGKGTGLGLSMVHSIVTSHFDGVVEMDTEVGRGTLFRIVFPLRVAAGVA